MNSQTKAIMVSGAAMLTAAHKPALTVYNWTTRTDSDVEPVQDRLSSEHVEHTKLVQPSSKFGFALTQSFLQTL